MSLSDSITNTNDGLYNPHIRIYAPGSCDKFGWINSTTFGEEGQSNLIFPEEISSDIEERKKYYRITAVVLEQNRHGHKRPKLTGQVISETLMGYLTKPIVDSIINKKR